MSDHDLRQLARTFQASHDPLDELRYLKAALAAGVVTREALMLSAYLGHPPACEAVSYTPARWPAPPSKTLRRHLRDRPTLLRRLNLAIARHDRTVLEHARAAGNDAFAVWVRLLDERIQAEEECLLRTDPVPIRVQHQRVVGGVWLQADDPDLQRVLAHLRENMGRPVLPAPSPVDPALQQAVRDELVPWLLHAADPVRDRQRLDLDALEIASPCSASWEDMHGDERVRHCEDCRLQVFDLSALSRADAEALVRERTGRLCVRMTRRADGTVLTRDCPEGLRERLAPYRPPEVVMGDPFSDV